MIEQSVCGSQSPNIFNIYYLLFLSCQYLLVRTYLDFLVIQEHDALIVNRQDWLVVDFQDLLVISYQFVWLIISFKAYELPSLVGCLLQPFVGHQPSSTWVMSESKHRRLCRTYSAHAYAASARLSRKS